MTNHPELSHLLVALVGALAVAAAAFFYRYVLRIFGVYIIPDDKIGVVIKKFVLIGANKRLPSGKLIALKGEAGIQADTLGPGLHLWLWPWQYTVEIVPMINVPPGKIGVIEAKDGMPGPVIAKHVDCDNFQDARAFLENGGERGVQGSIIPPGVWRLNTLLFDVELADMTVISQDSLGVVEARDGKPLSNGRVLAKTVECDMFQNVQAFFDNGGERGPQMAIVPPGQYKINPRMFNVTRAAVTEVPDNMVGVVTTKEGRPLPTGEIAGPEVPGHNMFQNPLAFVEKDGTKGLQEQVLQAGRYYINPKFATVETVDMFDVPIAHVGVVVSFVGEAGEDVTGDTFKHGNLVKRGQRGVWAEVLDPGKYPINPRTHQVVNVPTANVVLNWAEGKSEAHKLDENLSTITVRSQDGFTFNLDVSQIIHIPRDDAPKVIARFGSMEALVTQVLEPVIGNYFRNAAQNFDVIDFLKDRSDRQAEAKAAISEALASNDVGGVDTLIGDIVPPPQLMDTLTSRKIAQQEQVTYETQRQAQVTRKELQEATAQADTQASVVTAKRSVEIAEFDAQARVNTAEGEAKAKIIQAKAEAQVLETVGNATATKTRAVGEAEAAVIKLKTQAVGQDNYRVIESVRELAAARISLVPTIVAGGSGQGGKGGLTGNPLVDVLLAQTVLSKLPHDTSGVVATGEPDKAEAISETAPTAESAGGPEAQVAE